MKRLTSWLEKGPLLTDGAWGTQLHLKGLEPGACPDAWNVTNPEAVAEVARSYVEAGSQVILTNTFRANPVSLPEEWKERAAEINAAGVRISKEAAAERALVFASIGPTGKMVAAGEISERDVKDAYEFQARALAKAGADALLIGADDRVASDRLIHVRYGQGARPDDDRRNAGTGCAEDGTGGRGRDRSQLRVGD